MSWQLAFSVKNETGQTIYDCSFVHYCNDNSNGKIFADIPNGETQSIGTITTYDYHKDYYAGLFRVLGTFHVFNCYCSAESGDDAITLILKGDSYTVQYYQGGIEADACRDKGYDYTP